jgi:FkbM family methyltransferase
VRAIGQLGRLDLGARVARHGDRLRKVTRAASVSGYRSALAHGVLAGSEHEAVLSGLVVDAIIDVGANRGQFSLVARQLFHGCPIVAIEPLPAPAAVFRRVLAGSAVLHECAVGRAEGKLEIFETRDDDSSSLLVPGEGQLQLSAGSTVTGKRLVGVRTLDDLTAQLAASNILLKLDVQGFELEALAGARRLLAEKVGHVYVEASFAELYIGQGLAHDVIHLLDLHGFDLTAMANPTTSRGSVVQADFLFSRRFGQLLQDEISVDPCFTGDSHDV